MNSSKKIFHAKNLTIFEKYEKNIYPYIVRSSTNNGIKGYIQKNIEFLNPENTLSFAQDTFTVYYQDIPYFTGNKVKILKPKNKFNHKIAMYIIASLNKTLNNYTWGVNSDVKFIKKITFEMPVKNNKIDYRFIENYITILENEHVQELEANRAKEYENYLKVTGYINDTLEEKEQMAINNSKLIDYEKFRIEDLFDIDTGRDVIIGKTAKGTYPLISHQHENNGITKYISKLENRKLFKASETIALADRGVFYATVQKEDFYIGTRVKALTFKDGKKSRKIRLFFATTINKLQALFTEYANNATDTLPRLEIYLPVTKSGEIDFVFMENYITAQEKLVIKEVIDWKNKIISTTKQVID